MSDEPTEVSNVPWIAIAVVMVVLGLGVTVVLGLADPPPPATPGDPVEHVAVDLGNWNPFPDVGPTALDAGAADAERDARPVQGD